MKYTIVAVFSISAICFFSCKKNQTNNPSTNFSSIDNALANEIPKAQTFTINAAAASSFYLSNGTRVAIPANAFVDNLGNPVSSGTITLNVLGLTTKADMMLTNVLPISNGYQLISGGEFKTTATNASGNLKLSPGTLITYHIPQGGVVTPNMEVFNGALNPAGVINWNIKDSSASYLVINGDTISMGCDSLSWVNADAFMPNPNYVTFNVTVTGVTILPTTSIKNYASYNAKKACWSMAQSITNNMYTENHVADIPCNFVCYFVQNGKFYGGIQPVTPAQNGNYTIVVSEIDPTIFSNQLKALP
jgi:hypothetical protein